MRRKRLSGSVSSRLNSLQLVSNHKLKYANALANLPKHILQDILDSVDTCYEADQPFEDFKIVLLGQFYFELLRLPLDMQGLKPSILMGKLKQSLRHGVIPDNHLFLAKFLLQLPPSMPEAVGSGNQKTAAAMVKAVDAMWDA
jgi:hypothetical protein